MRQLRVWTVAYRQKRWCWILSWIMHSTAPLSWMDLHWNYISTLEHREVLRLGMRRVDALQICVSGHGLQLRNGIRVCLYRLYFGHVW